MDPRDASAAGKLAGADETLLVSEHRGMARWAEAAANQASVLQAHERYCVARNARQAREAGGRLADMVADEDESPENGGVGATRADIGVTPVSYSPTGMASGRLASRVHSTSDPLPKACSEGGRTVRSLANAIFRMRYAGSFAEPGMCRACSCKTGCGINRSGDRMSTGMMCPFQLRPASARLWRQPPRGRIVSARSSKP